MFSSAAPISPFLRRCLLAALLVLIPFASRAQTLAIHDDIQTVASLTNTTVMLTGRAELRVTGTGDPLTGCIVHLNSPDSMLLLTGIVPSATVSTFLPRVRVDGAVAVSGGNVRVVQYAHGAAVVPHSPDFAPLEVFDGRYFTGASKFLTQYTAYNNALLGNMVAAIGSFKLKRGYMATFATQESGAGISRNYVAQDGDLEISLLPSTLDNAVRFVRVFPWRWVSKKGSCDVDPVALKADWHYNWSISWNSTLGWEYVAIKQQPYWPGLDEDWKTHGVNHLSGFNEPNNSVEDAYQNLTPPGSVSDAVARWDELLGTGLRVGAPAVTDGGYSWIVDFINQANAAGKRVDYVPVHYYRSTSGNNPTTAANNLYNFLKSIYDVAQRPIWVTEFNNGANWTDNAHDPDATQNRDVIEAMIEMMDSTPWIERYAIYSNVEWFRDTHYAEGGLTPMGSMYRDHAAPIAYLQEMPDSGTGTSTRYSFDGHSRDMSGNGLDAMRVGAPRFVPGRYGQAIDFNGSTDYLQITPRTGDNTDFSFAGWVNWAGGGDWQRIFDLGEDGDHYLFLCPRTAAGNLRFAINTGGGEQQLSAPALTPGVWTHVAVTISGSTGKMFVNGALVATNTGMTYNPVDVGTKYNWIGKSRFAADPLLNGRLDDLRFLSSALTDAQVAAIASTAPPQFLTQTLWKANAAAGTAYSASLAADVVGGAAPLTFSKMDGPAWLTVSAAGALGGTPMTLNAGLNNALVKVADANGSMHTAMLTIVVPPVTSIIVTGTDDAEESAAGAMDLDSSDIELVNDGALGNQVVGLRFAGLAIPQGAVVASAVLQFTADEAHSEATTLDIVAENADDSAEFTTAAGNLSTRAGTWNRVQWSPPAWATVGEVSTAQRTPNLAGVVQQVVSRSGWASGNALTFLIRGTGHRTADAFEKAGGTPAKLIVTFTTPVPLLTATAGIALGANDAEQSAAGAVTLDSSDLELVNDGALGNQTIGLRFEKVALPAGAVIANASIQFTADEVQSEATALTLRVQAADNAPIFTTTANDLAAAARPRTFSSYIWVPPTWATVGEAGSAQRTPDLSTLVGEVASRPGWAAGNAMAFFLTGTGHRTAEAAEKVGGFAPVLSIAYRQQIPIGSYEHWASLNSNPGALTADPDKDGQTNLVEYALGLDPMRADPATLPLSSSGGWLWLTYTLSAQAADVTCAAEWCDDLVAGPWSTAGIITYIVADTGTTRTMQAAIPIGTSGHRCVRLRVTR